MQSVYEFFKHARNYDYFTYPDGEDQLNKLLVVNHKAASAGILIATMDTMLVSKPKGVLGFVGRFAYYIGPLMAMASAFEVTKTGLCRLRQKDDIWNWGTGGVAAGVVCGAWLRSRPTGMFVGLGLALLAMAKKDTRNRGVHLLFPDSVGQEQATLWYPDYTLCEDLPRNWTPGPPKSP